MYYNNKMQFLIIFDIFKITYVSRNFKSRILDIKMLFFNNICYIIFKNNKKRKKMFLCSYVIFIN